jgi:hypothetical protein
MSGLGRALGCIVYFKLRVYSEPGLLSASSPRRTFRLIIYIYSSFGAPYELLAAK